MARTSLPPTFKVVLLAGTILVGPVFVDHGGTEAQAQIGALLSGKEAPVSKNDPVTFTADSVEYDRDGALVTATGHVEAWQGDRVLRADRVTFDRNTNVAAATGNVVLLEPDGQVLFSDYAELTQGMKEGVLRGLRSRLAENGKLAANGARRLDAGINELSRVIYSTCNVCAQHPDEPMIWDIRARSALQDVDHKTIEYRDAVVDFYGLPVAYFPYLSQPDPSQKRATGLLIPAIGSSSHLGAYLEVPYYIVLDAQSDATVTPILATKTGPGVDIQYRRRFNDGTVSVDSSLAYDNKAAQGAVFAKGQFAYDDTWRYGFDINRASSSKYVRDFRIRNESTDLLTSSVYVEGFGQGSYSRLDARVYQGLSSSIISAKLPYALPRWEYSFVGEPDAWGGRFGIDVGAFNLIRDQGTTTQRASLSANWERPFNGALGDLYKLVLHVDSAGYVAHGLNQQPNYSNIDVAQTAQAMPTAALEFRMPFARDAGTWGTQTLEPIAQVIGAPNGSRYTNSRVPNEDSLDLEFTDANLFSLNRYPGVDRLEGGVRANVALHAAWNFPGGAVVDGLVGQGYRARKDNAFPVSSGLHDTVTDVVSHLSFTPNEFLDITTRERFDHKTFNVKFADALASAGPKILRLNAGYIYTADNPYLYFDNAPNSAANANPSKPRDEITFGASTQFGPYKLNGFARRNLTTGAMVAVGANGSYEDECFIFNAQFFKRYTSFNNDHGDTTFLLQVTLKTVGQFGYHAL